MVNKRKGRRVTSASAPSAQQQHQPRAAAAIVADPCDSVVVDLAARGALRDAALDYAARGLPVFPCHAGGKTPLTRRGYLDASSHHEHVWHWWRRWPNANIGLATGQPSGLLVIDLDGPQGRESWERLTAEQGKVTTLTAITGGLGVHAVFAYPDGAEIGNSAGKLGPGIDVRGQGGYVIVPPSLHGSGRRYGWLESSPGVPQGVRAAQEAFWRAPAPCPAWLVELLRAPAHRQLTATWPAPAGDEPAKLAAFVARQVEGRRNDALYWAACTLLEHGHAGAVLDQLADGAQRAGLSEREVRATIASACSRVQGHAS